MLGDIIFKSALSSCTESLDNFLKFIVEQYEMHAAINWSEHEEEYREFINKRNEAIYDQTGNQFFLGSIPTIYGIIYHKSNIAQKAKSLSTPLLNASQHQYGTGAEVASNHEMVNLLSDANDVIARLKSKNYAGIPLKYLPIRVAHELLESKGWFEHWIRCEYFSKLFLSRFLDSLDTWKWMMNVAAGVQDIYFSHREIALAVSIAWQMEKAATLPYKLKGYWQEILEICGENLKNIGTIGDASVLDKRFFHVDFFFDWDKTYFYMLTEDGEYKSISQSDFNNLDTRISNFGESTAPILAAVVTKKHVFNIAGVTYNNIDGESRQNIISMSTIGQQLKLVREPRNAHDKNAIMIIDSFDRQLGYVPKEIAPTLAQKLDQGINFSAIIRGIIGGQNGLSYGCCVEVTEWGNSGSMNKSNPSVSNSGGCLLMLFVPSLLFIIITLLVVVLTGC